jgi:5-methylcytosine-specific restriction endonuclease McrA
MPWRPKTHAQILREKNGEKRRETRTPEQLRENAKIWDARWRKFAKRIKAERVFCEDCEAEGLPLTLGDEVHHIKKARDYPELRFDEDNVLLLCTTHHSRRTRRGE